MRKKLFYLIPILTLSMLSSLPAYAANTSKEATEVSTEKETEELLETEDSSETEDLEETVDPVDHIYTFTLNEITYTLPCAVTEFIDNGWIFERGTLKAHAYANAFGYYEDNQNPVVFEITNFTDEENVDINELIVTGITVSNTNITEKDYTFETTDGIVPGMTVEEIKELYDEPEFEHDTYMTYHFQKLYETEGMRGFGISYAGEDSFTLYLKDGIVDRVQLEYFGIETEEEVL